MRRQEFKSVAMYFAACFNRFISYLYCRQRFVVYCSDAAGTWGTQTAPCWCPLSVGKCLRNSHQLKQVQSTTGAQFTPFWCQFLSAGSKCWPSHWLTLTAGWHSLPLLNLLLGNPNHVKRTSFIHRYSALGPVWAETRAQSGDWCSSGTLHPGQVLRGRLPFLSPVPTAHGVPPPKKKEHVDQIWESEPFSDFREIWQHRNSLQNIVQQA
jgi:hypothetical protein